MSIKDQLLKAGFKPSVNSNIREEKKGPRKASERHQAERNFCEQCESIFPDVEKYNHKNPTTFAKWICAACADKLEILDRFRVTAQSEFSKSGRFRREYGETYKMVGGKLQAPSEMKGKKRGGPDQRFEGRRGHRDSNRSEGNQKRGPRRPQSQSKKNYNK